MVQDFDTIATAMSQVDVETADASVPADKVAIKQLIQEEMGFGEVNKQVIGELRDWLAAAGRAALEELPADERGTSCLINNLAMLLRDQGRLKEAEPLYTEALQARREVLGDRHPDTQSLLRQLEQRDRARRIQLVLSKLQQAASTFAEGMPLITHSAHSDSIHGRWAPELSNRSQCVGYSGCHVAVLLIE